MLGALFRVIFYLGPFIKEVFISSSEEKRLWMSRFFLTLLAAIMITYFGVQHVIVELNALERENLALREQLLDKDESIQLWASRHDVLQGIISDKNETIKQIVDHNQQLYRDNGELKAELAFLKTKLPPPPPPALPHSLPPTPVPATPKAEPDKVVSPPVSKKLSPDRLEELN